MKQLLTILLFCTAFVRQASGQAGQLDPTFGTDGKYSYPLEGKNIYNLGLQSDNKIVGVGVSEHLSSTGLQQDVYTVRFLADGGIDSSYGTDGFSPFLEGPGLSKYVYSLAIQPDDKILVVGRTTYLSKQNFYICRFNADGSVDSSFGDNGFVMIAITVGSIDQAMFTNVLNDNKILVTGKAGNSLSYVRLMQNGNIDSTFGINGISLIDDIEFESNPTNTQIQSDGKILTSLFLNTVNRPFAILRLNAVGLRDVDFGINGFTTISFPRSATPYKIMLRNDEKIVVGGNLLKSSGSSQYDIALARLNSNGTLDESFGTLGKIVASLPNSVDMYMTFELQSSDQKILCLNSQLSSGANQYYQCVRFLPDGSLDNEWNGTGSRIDTFLENGIHSPLNIIYTEEGKIILIGASLPNISSPNFNLDFARFYSCGVSITAQPADASGTAGGSATFSLVSSSPSAVYQWQVEEGGSWSDLTDDLPQYSGTQTATLTVSALTTDNDGDRYRAIAISGSCTDTSAAAVLRVSPTSVDNPYFQTLSIYPNPVTADLVNIDRGSHREALNITVTDQGGKQMHSLRDGHSASGGSKIQIDTQGWPAGTYYIQVRTDDGESTTYTISKL